MHANCDDSIQCDNSVLLEAQQNFDSRFESYVIVSTHLSSWYHNLKQIQLMRVIPTSSSLFESNLSYKSECNGEILMQEISSISNEIM